MTASLDDKDGNFVVRDGTVSYSSSSMGSQEESLTVPLEGNGEIIPWQNAWALYI